MVRFLFSRIAIATVLTAAAVFAVCLLAEAAGIR